MTLLRHPSDLLGPAQVLTGADMARHAQDWTGRYAGTPLTVVRPATTAEGSAVMQIAQRHKISVVPISGNTGLVGNTHTAGGLITRIRARLGALQRTAEPLCAAHLGAGHLHFTVFPKAGSEEICDQVIEQIDDVVVDLDGSFPAEHRVDLSKLGSMARRKDRSALDVMRAIKAARDPEGWMNRGKHLPQDWPLGRQQGRPLDEPQGSSKGSDVTS